jgi:hypothetical protein
MLLKQSFSFTAAEALKEGKIYSQNTLVISLRGRNGPRQRFEDILSLIAVADSHVETLYRHKDPNKWYLVLNAAGYTTKHRGLLGLKKNFPEAEVSMHIFAQEEDRSRGCILWLPYTFQEKCVKEIVSGMTGDPEPKITKDAKRNQWFFHYKPVQGVDIPHYVSVDIVGETNKKGEIWVRLPGRLTDCKHCGLNTHWDSQCPSRGSRPLDGPPPRREATRPETCTDESAPTTSSTTQPPKSDERDETMEENSRKRQRRSTPEQILKAEDTEKTDTSPTPAAKKQLTDNKRSIPASLSNSREPDPQVTESDHDESEGESEEEGRQDEEGDEPEIENPATPVNYFTPLKPSTPKKQLEKAAAERKKWQNREEVRRTLAKFIADSINKGLLNESDVELSSYMDDDIPTRTTSELRREGEKIDYDLFYKVLPEKVTDIGIQDFSVICYDDENRPMRVVTSDGEIYYRYSRSLPCRCEKCQGTSGSTHELD